MVGGRVIGIVRRDGQPTILHVRDTRNTDQVCVDVREYRIDGQGPVEISIGDQVWWQGGMVLWTPSSSEQGHHHEDHDIRLPKMGYTYSPSHALAGDP